MVNLNKTLLTALMIMNLGCASHKDPLSIALNTVYEVNPINLVADVALSLKSKKFKEIRKDDWRIENKVYADLDNNNKEENISIEVRKSNDNKFLYYFLLEDGDGVLKESKYKFLDKHQVLLVGHDTLDKNVIDYVGVVLEKDENGYRQINFFYNEKNKAYGAIEVNAIQSICNKCHSKLEELLAKDS